ncbi:cupin domain-containing protein [Parvularcula sp. IMCC14364]|uniref:cupin domain-containing protein n=1 Tax=Parvularcula sp. IMCC14364 TaxID=3067902 RepID=UPI0027423BC8|nr:cupin domain-containing protein [Parvularcula sp. IMCC14364]
MQAVNIANKFSQFTEQWQPKRIATVNDYDVRIAKIEGEFVWHSHEDTDEMFLVVKGSMKILLRDGEVSLNEGEVYVVPRGVEHKPVADRECQILLIEPTDVVNTGTAGGERTATVETL